MKTSKQSRLWASLLLLALFGLSFASGWFAHRYAASSEANKNRSHRARGHWRKRFLGRLSSQLQLTGKQQTSIVAVLNRYRPVYRKLRASLRPKIREMRERMRSDIKALLRPEQQKRFVVMLKEAKARRAKRRKRKQP